jgi:hypothetical protein
MDDLNLRVLPPILQNKHCDLASAFAPESVLRKARRQKDVPNTPVLEICVLDPDGDIVRHLCAEGRSRPVAGWASGERNEAARSYTTSGARSSLDHLQPDCAGRTWSISLFDRMIHAPGTFRSARSCSREALVAWMWL